MSVYNCVHAAANFVNSEAAFLLVKSVAELQKIAHWMHNKSTFSYLESKNFLGGALASSRPLLCEKETPSFPSLYPLNAFDVSMWRSITRRPLLFGILATALAYSDLMQFSCTTVFPWINQINGHFSFLYFFFKTPGTLSRV